MLPDFATVSSEQIPFDEACGGGESDKETTYTDWTSGSFAPLRLPPKIKRPTTEFMTPKLAAVLDRAKISNPMATMVLSASLESFGLDTENYALNVSSVRNARDWLRKQESKRIKENFTNRIELNHTVHFDGKRLKDSKTGKFKEILPVLLTGRGCDQLLGCPQLPSGTGEDTALKIFELLLEWGAEKVVRAVCADTTNVITGGYRQICNTV